ncbi:MAG: M17 family peptidase N-terminal domain-containing protein, partial [Polyangiaceae bacterium]
MAANLQAKDASSHVVIIGTWTLPAAKDGKARKLPDSVMLADTAIGGGIAEVVTREEFSGKREQALSLPTFGKFAAGRVVFLGLGDKSSAKEAEIRTFGARCARIANGDKARELTIVVPDGVETRLRALAEGLELGAYRFTKYLTGDRIPKEALEDVAILTSKKLGVMAKKDLDLGQQVATGVNVARDLSNEPPNVMTPAQLAAESQKIGKAHPGLKVTVFDFKEIRKRGMHLIDAVGRGSTNEPRFIHIAW